MFSAESTPTVSALQRFSPLAKMPAPAVLRNLSAAEADVLVRRLAEPVEYVQSTLFADANAEQMLLQPVIDVRAARKRRAVQNDDSGVFHLDTPAPVFDAEKHLFLKLNYCRFRVAKIVEAVGERRLTAETARDLVRWETLVCQTRSDIVRLNVPLVLAMAKRTRINGVDYADLISEGNLALLRSVDKFDCARGFKFSTYACRAILKSFSRVAGRTSRYRGHFPTEFDPSLEKSDFIEQRRETAEGDCLAELKSVLGNNLAKLNEIEQQVIRARFALDQPASDLGPRAKTLEQVGEMIGVTKERVRQIQNKALIKLRSVLEHGVLAD